MSLTAVPEKGKSGQKLLFWWGHYAKWNKPGTERKGGKKKQNWMISLTCGTSKSWLHTNWVWNGGYQGSGGNGGDVC